MCPNVCQRVRQVPLFELATDRFDNAEEWDDVRREAIVADEALHINGQEFLLVLECKDSAVAV